MQLLTWRKDGGPDSKVHGFFVVELKKLFTVAVLRFDEGSREAYHSHAFNSVSWVLRGNLWEWLLDSTDENIYGPSLKPVITRRSTFHKVFGMAPRTWVLTFRGPWSATWQEYVPGTKSYETLTHGRIPAVTEVQVP